MKNNSNKIEIDFDDDFILSDHKQNIDKVMNNLYIGSSRGALDKKYLVELNVKKILVCGDDLRLFFPKSFNYKVIPIKDDSDMDISQYFKECLEFIDSELDSLEGCFVHCKRGVSRSATIVIAYLMWKLKNTFQEAFTYLKEKRLVICPNNGFVMQLKNFEKHLVENDWNFH
jgi:protein-tyrosine phosphatase